MIARPFSIFILLCLLPMVAFSQNPPTGTRINSSRAANAITVVNLQQPDEIREIERLLAARKTAEAYELASGYVEEVDRAALDGITRYFAHNALCVVYTQMREYDQAMNECDIAIGLVGGHWSAWNNRGTLRYLAEDYEGAKEDYQSALMRTGNSESVIELVRYNIDLANIRLLPTEQQK